MMRGQHELRTILRQDQQYRRDFAPVDPEGALARLLAEPARLRRTAARRWALDRDLRRAGRVPGGAKRGEL